jgi:hypothetical protein
MRLNDQDKKEIAIWGGAAFVVILVVNSFLIGGQVDSLQSDINRAKTLDQQYAVFYPEEQAGRLPEAEAQAQAERVLTAQQNELGRATRQLVFPGDGRLVPQELVQFDFHAGVDFNTARNLVQEVNRRLSGRGTSWSVRMPEVLPFEGAGDINPDEEGAALRSLQMAQLAAYGSLYEHLLQARPSSIGAVNLGAEIVCDPARQIAVIPVATSVSGSHEQIRRIEQLLRDSSSGLALQTWDMQRQGNAYTVALKVHLLVPKHQAWDISPMSVPTSPGPDPRG